MSESASKPTFSIAQRIRRKPRRFQGALSPWTRRLLGLRTSTRPGQRIARSPATGLTRKGSQPRSGLFRSHIPTAGIARRSRAKAQRVSKNAHRVRVWRPGLGGVSPAGVHRFSNHITRRFDTGPGSRYRNKPGQTFKPIEMPLYNRGGRTELVNLRRNQWQPVSTPQSALDEADPTAAAPPPNFMRAKKAVAENQAPKPSIARRARLYSRVEESTSTDQPAFIDQSAIETEIAPQPPAQPPAPQPAQPSSQQPAQPSLQQPAQLSPQQPAQQPAQPSPQQPPTVQPETVDRDTPISAPQAPVDASKSYQASSLPLARRHNRPKLRLNASASPIRVRRRVTATMEQRGWRFKRSTAQTSGSPTMIYRAASRLDRAATAGRPLQGRPRALMRQTFGRDFGKVRIHKADLSPLNVEAATRGQDVYMQDNSLETPASLGTLGHELSHVAHNEGDTASAKPKLQMAALPQARLSQEERSAEQAEHAVHSSMDMPMTRSAPSSLQRAPLDRAPSAPGSEEGGDEDPNNLEGVDDMNSFGELQTIIQSATRQLIEMGLYPPDSGESDAFLSPQDQEELQSIEAIEVANETASGIGGIAAMMNILIEQADEEEGEEEGEDTVLEITDDELDHLAMRVYPFLKRLLAVERERYAIQDN
jgi:hypothetical protein